MKMKKWTILIWTVSLIAMMTDGSFVTYFISYIVYYTGMFPVGDTSCRTLIDVCVCVCVCVCQSVRRHIAKLRQE